MSKTHKVFNLIILDESGSMNSIKNTIISGFNEVVQTVKGVAKQYPEQAHFISLVTFNSLHTNTLLENESVEKLNEIDKTKYNPTAGTPLFDAMGNSISQLRKITQTHSDYNVLVTILTDGEENSSKEFNGKTIKQMVDELKQQNWTFTYIGANHDVEAFAASISITNTMKFEANDQDIKKMFSKEKSSRMKYSAKIRNNEDTSKGFYD
ncbi:vWA domain-containing protein [Bernardetia sp. ABR2-2B]|uniref:vWA domain-containing protein n=1 Tax=Bernardetia sp. ABR2-2B TaxID=3127472 RepID=UPI0030D19813